MWTKLSSVLIQIVSNFSINLFEVKGSSKKISMFPTTCLFILLISVNYGVSDPITLPNFVSPISNVTVPVGREAVITCTVDNLGSYKVAWVRVDTQTILTIHTHVITRSHRINLSHTDSWTWNLIIKNVRESDRGWYMCQINTDPMMSQTGYLQVVVPPDILDYPTSSDMVVREGTNVSLQCAATGFPEPRITWRREDKQKITIDDMSVETKEGPFFNLTKVNRLHMGVYLCIASNFVPPTVSRRISLIVHFPPMIWIPNQLVGAAVGQDVILECHSEAFPKSINYWKRDNGDTIVAGSKDSSTIEGDKYNSTIIGDSALYKVTMRLIIREIDEDDYGEYICLSKNSLGDTDGKIKIYPISPPPVPVSTKSTTLPSSNTINKQNHLEKDGRQRFTGKSDSTSGNGRPYNSKVDLKEILNKQRNEIISGEEFLEDSISGSSGAAANIIGKLLLVIIPTALGFGGPIFLTDLINWNLLGIGLFCLLLTSAGFLHY